MKQIAIIGGGAAGLTAAVAAARTARAADETQITVYDLAERVGKSILVTGNGRCNFSNRSISAKPYYNSDFVSQTFDAVPVNKVWSFFEDLGLLWRENREGWMYPLTNKANSLLDVLRAAAIEGKVKERLGHEVMAVTPSRGRYLVMLSNDEAILADKVIVAAGGKITRSMFPSYYNYYNTQPLLGPLQTETECIKGLDNIRVQAALLYGEQREAGEVLFRKYGISGISAFNLSRYVQAGDSIAIDFLPQFSHSEAQKMLDARFEREGHRTAGDFCIGMLQSSVARAVLRAAGLHYDEPLCEQDLISLVKALKGFSLKVKGVGDRKQCQVSRGGFAVEGFNPATLESLSDKGLFLVGEALDVDGPCGGFNLHWAWASGIAAGRAAAQ